MAQTPTSAPTTAAPTAPTATTTTTTPTAATAGNAAVSAVEAALLAGSSLKAAIEDYKKSLSIFSEDIYKAAVSFKNDYGTGYTLQRNTALGLVEQPIARFDISNQFDIRVPAYTLNSSYIVNQGKSIRNNTTLYNVLCDHSWTEAKTLICQQTSNYHRQVRSQDYCFSTDYLRQMGNSLHSADYYKVQVGATAPLGAKLNGPAGRYDLTAKESVNLEAVTGHFMCRAKKTASFKVQDFFVSAGGSFILDGKTTGTINSLGPLILSSKTTANLSSIGITTVSSSIKAIVQAPIVHINPGVAGVKLPVNLDLVEAVKAAGFSPTLSGLIGIASNVLAGGSVDVGSLASLGLSSLGVDPTLTKVISAGVQGVATENFKEAIGSVVGAVSAEAVGVIGDQLAAAGIPADIAGPLADGFVSMGVNTLTGGTAGLKDAAIATGTQLIKNGLTKLLSKAGGNGGGAGTPPPPPKLALAPYPAIQPVEKVGEQPPGLPAWMGVSDQIA